MSQSISTLWSKRNKYVIFDIETNCLDNPDQLWCVVFKELFGAQQTKRFSRLDGGFDPAIHSYLSECLAADAVFVGHNAVDYDCKWLEHLLGIDGVFTEHNVVDTLVLSRLFYTDIPNGHSLDAWGKRLRFPKIEHTDFSQYSPQMVEYCENDVELTARLFEYLSTKLGDENVWSEAIHVEHATAWTARRMHERGFKFDITSAKSMLKELETKVQGLYDAMVETFPPRIKVTELKTRTKVEEIPFNPGSPKQVVERLNEFGWKPVDKTKGHIQAELDKDTEKLERFKVYGWKVNERNLDTLPDDAPEACNLLVEWLLTDSRRRTLIEWMKAYSNASGRIHGQFNPLGTRTQRWVHSKPNMGNIPTAKTIKYNRPKLRELAIEYGKRMRSMWVCDDDSWLVGIDLEAAHLRIFAHLINDEAFTHALVSGDKANGTDPHTLNKEIIGDICVDRDRAKTFIFTFLNGGGASKVSEIFNVSVPTARAALEIFIDAYPGLRRLKSERIPEDADRGYFVGVDGRYVINRSKHHMMGMYLQNAEAVLMKYFIKNLRLLLDKQSINYNIVNCVHDEVVLEVKGDKSVAEFVGKLGNQVISDLTTQFKYNCPLAGEYKVGKNWYQVH